MGMSDHNALVKQRGVPEVGQLVEIRSRQWIVANVDTALEQKGQSEQSLINLASIDEDALGEELQVIWELEPGAHIIERAGLPEVTGSFDDPKRLEAFPMGGCNQRRPRLFTGAISKRY